MGKNKGLLIFFTLFIGFSLMLVLLCPNMLMATEKNSSSMCRLHCSGYYLVGAAPLANSMIMQVFSLFAILIIFVNNLILQRVILPLRSFSQDILCQLVIFSKVVLRE